MLIKSTLVSFSLLYSLLIFTFFRLPARTIEGYEILVTTTVRGVKAWANLDDEASRTRLKTWDDVALSTDQSANRLVFNTDTLPVGNHHFLLCCSTNAATHTTNWFVSRIDKNGEKVQVAKFSEDRPKVTDSQIRFDFVVDRRLPEVTPPIASSPQRPEPVNSNQTITEPQSTPPWWAIFWPKSNLGRCIVLIAYGLIAGILVYVTAFLKGHGEERGKKLAGPR